jgi:hypothetical protein
MSLSVTQIIDTIASQYTGDSRLTNMITIATQRTSEEAFGENYNYAIALRTAHMLTLADMNSGGVSSGLGGAVGAITQKSEGNTSISFGSNSSLTGTSGKKAGDLALTRYGLELLGLIAGNIVGISVANYSNVTANINNEEEE